LSKRRELQEVYRVAMMRLVAVADTHMFEEDLGTLPEGDVLVHAGDLLRRGTLEELERVVPWLIAQPHRHKVVIAGHHDGCFERAERTRALEMLGDSVVYPQDADAALEGRRVWGRPGRPAS